MNSFMFKHTIHHRFSVYRHFVRQRNEKCQQTYVNVTITQDEENFLIYLLQLAPAHHSMYRNCSLCIYIRMNKMGKMSSIISLNFIRKKKK